MLSGWQMFTEEIRSQLVEVGSVGEETGASLDAGAPRIAVYDADGAPPRVVPVPESRLPELIDTLTTRTYDLAHQQGSRLPYTVLREVVENLIHAWFEDVVTTILDGGNTIRISDRGPGIEEKVKVLEPGFTTAGPKLKRYIKGVGSGLPVAKELLAHLDGLLEIEDNLGTGTVVTLSLPTSAPPPVIPSPPLSEAPLSERQLKILFLLVELGATGPSRLAKELSISASTAYRDLVVLEGFRLVRADTEGRRTITQEGLRHLDGVL